MSSLSVVRPGTRAGIGFIVVSCAGFSVQGTLTRFAYRASATPLMVGLGRFMVAAVVLWAYLLVMHRSALNVPLRTAVTLLALGGIGYFLMSLTYLLAIVFIPVALASFIGYLYPVLATGIAVRLGRDHLTFGLVVGLVVSLGGLCIMLSGPTTTAHGGAAWQGIACMIGNAIAVATYIVTSDRVLVKVHTVTAMAFIATGAAISNGVAGFITQSIHVGVRLDTWLWIMAIGLFSTVLASATQLAALRRLGPTRTATLSTLEAVSTLGVASLVLGEPIRPLQAIGGFVLVAGAIKVIQARRPTWVSAQYAERQKAREVSAGPL